MPKTNKVDSAAWLSPELYPDLAPGQYRTVPESGDPLDGDLVVWVDDNPDDAADGSGHFELYDGKPADYEYNTRAAYMRKRATQPDPDVDGTTTEAEDSA